MADEKRHTISPGEHAYTRPASLSDSQFIQWVRGMPAHLLRRKLTGPQAREFQRQFDEAVSREKENK